MEKEQLKDDFLGSLLQSSQTEKPSFNFTANVMSDIQQFEAEKARNPLFSIGNILLAIGGIITVVLVYFVVWPFLGDFGILTQGLNPERYGNYLNTILSSFQGFLSLVEYLKGSSITLIVLFVIPALILLDRVLKRVTSRTYLFLF
jgi:hypothetical protein